MVTMKLSELIAPLDDTAAKVALANIAAILGSAPDWSIDQLEAIADEIIRLKAFPPICVQTGEDVTMWETIDWSA